jgi:hypothetical protein
MVRIRPSNQSRASNRLPHGNTLRSNNRIRGPGDAMHSLTIGERDGADMFPKDLGAVEGQLNDRAHQSSKKRGGDGDKPVTTTL